MARHLPAWILACWCLASCQSRSSEAYVTLSAQPTEKPSTAERIETPLPSPTPAPEPTPTLAPDEWETVDPSGQKVVFWHNYLYERQAAMDELIRAFNDENEYGITVQGVFKGGADDVFAQTLATLGTDTMPDMVVAFQNHAAMYQQSGGNTDITTLVESRTWGLSTDDLAGYYAPFLAQDKYPTFSNARLSFPHNRSAEVLYYNPEWLAELSPGFEGPPQTPEAFREAACAASKQPFSRAVGVIPAIGYEVVPGASTMASWIFAFGGDIFDEETGRFAYDTPEAVEAMEFLQGLLEDGCARMAMGAFTDQEHFGDGTTLFTLGTSSGMFFYNRAVQSGAQFGWDVAAVPYTTPEPVVNIYGPSIAILENSPERKLAAWLFVRYLTSPVPQARWAEASGYFPVHQQAPAEMAVYLDENPPYATAFALVTYGTSEPSIAGYEMIRGLASRAMEDIGAGVDAERRLQNLTLDANEILAEEVR